MKRAISVIIPAYNEERTLSSIVEIVRTWGKAKEIIVVDDGSTDQTYASVHQFEPSIRILRHKKNQGKAAAMVDGIEASTGDILFFLDADTIGLTHKDLDAMLVPVHEQQAAMVLGMARFWSAGKFEPWNKLTGQRVVLRQHIEPELSRIRNLGYGVELFLNKHFERQRVVEVRLPHVYILGKLEKQTLPRAVLTYAKEGRDLLSQFILQYSDKIDPKARKILTQLSRLLMKIFDAIG